jgi:hypothetical protein
MFNARLLRRVRVVVFAAVGIAGSTLCSCGLTDIRDNLVSGALGAVEDAAGNAINSLIPDFLEFFGTIPPEA